MKKWLKGGIVGGGIGVLFSLMAWIFFLVENKMAITNTFVFGIEQIILFPLWFIGSLAGIIVFYIILGFGLYVPPATKVPQTQTNQTGSYSCDCSKLCSQMASCEEAYYQLNQCGCSKRDGDSDGVPCESICP